MDQERIWILIGRKLAGEISSQEREELDELMRQCPVDVDAYRQLLTGRVAWEEEDEGRTAAGIYWEQHKELIRHLPGPVREGRSGTRRIVLRLAAACATLLLVFAVWKFAGPGLSFFDPSRPDYAEITTGEHEKARLELPDGTQVWLNRNSTFRYNKNMNRADTRTAFLSGEAYFDVTSDSGHPFIIHTDKMDIRVVGTAFNVQAYPRDTIAETALFRGEVEVTLKDPHAEKGTMILQPEEKLVVRGKKIQAGKAGKAAARPGPAASKITGYTLSEIAGPAREDLYKENAWVSNNVVFNNESFEEIGLFLEKRYRVEVRFRSRSMAETRFRGVFSDESIEGVLEALKFTAGFEYTIRDSVVTIY